MAILMRLSGEQIRDLQIPQIDHQQTQNQSSARFLPHNLLPKWIHLLLNENQALSRASKLWQKKPQISRVCEFSNSQCKCWLVLPHIRKEVNVALWIAQIEYSVNHLFLFQSLQSSILCCTVVRRGMAPPTVAFRAEIFFFCGEGDCSWITNKYKVTSVIYPYPFNTYLMIKVSIRSNLCTNLSILSHHSYCWCVVMRFLDTRILHSYYNHNYNDHFVNQRICPSIYFRHFYVYFILITICLLNPFAYIYQPLHDQYHHHHVLHSTHHLLRFLLCSFLLLWPSCFFPFLFSKMDIDKGKGMATFANVTVSDPALNNTQKINKEYKKLPSSITNSSNIPGTNTKGTMGVGSITKPAPPLGKHKTNYLGFNPISIYYDLFFTDYQQNLQMSVCISLESVPSSNNLSFFYHCHAYVLIAYHLGETFASHIKATTHASTQLSLIFCSISDFSFCCVDWIIISNPSMNLPVITFTICLNTVYYCNQPTKCIVILFVYKYYPFEFGW